jgi:hypothetical protein
MSFATTESTAFENDEPEVITDETPEQEITEEQANGLYDFIKAHDIAPLTEESRKEFFERVNAHFARKGQQ